MKKPYRQIAPLTGSGSEEIDRAILFPVSDMIAAEAQLSLKTAVPGQRLLDGGIYLGKYSPQDRAGNSLGKIFNVVVAPRDVPGIRTYLETVAYLAGLKDWYGFDGEAFATDKELYQALRDEAYRGGWVIPTFDIFRGESLNFAETMQDHLLARRNEGAFRDSLVEYMNDESTPRCGYCWSSTEVNPSSVIALLMPSNGARLTANKGSNPARCRPVRLVEIKK